MAKKQSSPRRRNILWNEEVDAIAESIAHHKNFKGGVSELLTRLVLAESKRKRGVAPLQKAAA